MGIDAQLSVRDVNEMLTRCGNLLHWDQYDLLLTQLIAQGVTCLKQN